MRNEAVPAVAHTRPDNEEAARHTAVVVRHTVAVVVPSAVAVVVPSAVAVAVPSAVAVAVPLVVAAVVPLVAVEAVHRLLLRFRIYCRSFLLQPGCRNLNKTPLIKTPSINLIFDFSCNLKRYTRILKTDIISLNCISQYVL